MNLKLRKSFIKTRTFVEGREKQLRNSNGNMQKYVEYTQRTTIDKIYKLKYSLLYIEDEANLRVDPISLIVFTKI